MPRFAAVAVAVAVLLLSSSLSAQDLESFAGMRLRFDAPGARAAAMGGASAALSDSFTGTTNPASLARQSKRVSSLELRSTSSDAPYVTGGSVGSFTSASFESTSRELASAIVVVPTQSATWAFYVDEPINATTDTTRVRSTGGLIGLGVRDDTLIDINDCRTDAPDCNFIYFSTPAVIPLDASFRLRRYGAAAGRQFGRIAVGGAVQYAQLEEKIDGTAGGQRAEDGRWSWNAGAQVDLTSRIRLGTSHQSAARFHAERKVLQAGGFEWVPTEIRTPSSTAVGIAADVTPNLTFAVDAVRVRYSEMLRGNFLSFFAGSNATSRYEFPDVIELRAGGEYRLRTRIPVALRAGVWREPSHRVRLGFSSDAPLNEAVNLIMLRDQDENHVTAGIGVGDRVRVDAAFDRSENTTRASLALATTF